jgi:signal transduction histidine kinase
MLETQDLFRADFFRAHARVVAYLAYLTLVLVFVIDAITPQTLSIEIAYEAAVVLAALTGNRILVARLLVLSLLGDLAGAAMDASAGGWHQDQIALDNRIISLFSIFIVGGLALSTQEKGETLGRADARARRQVRDGILLKSFYRFWSSLEPSKIAAVVAEEAAANFNAAEVVWCPDSSAQPILTTGLGQADAAAHDWPAPDTSDFALLAPLALLRSIEIRQPAAGFAKALGASERSRHYLVVPIGNDTTRFGVLLISTQAPEVSAETVDVAAEFALRVFAAMEQTHVTEQLRERNAALAARQETIQELVEAISHDVRTPLVALSLTLQQAIDGAFGPLSAAYASVLADSRNSIEAIQGLAETLLLVARFEAEAPRDAPEAVGMKVLVREITSELSNFAAARGLTLRTEVAPGATVTGTRSDLRRAISNLIANAIGNTPRGGTIDLAVTSDESHVEVAVSDDGYGVAPALRPALFQRFRKAHGTDGTGLGLYIVRRVAEETGGYARYESREPHGSIFTISLPSATRLVA